MRGLKQCGRCGETKPFTDFYADSRSRDGLRSMCMVCQRIYDGTPARRAVRARYNKSPAGKATNKSSRRRSKYGLEPGDYEELLGTQGGSCALPSCGRPATDIDHDHAKRRGEPGFVRGILCSLHNTALGSFNDNPVCLADAIAYLRGELKERPPFGGPESPTVKLD
jgi:hypothetical protein